MSLIRKGTAITFTAVGSTGEIIPRTADDLRSGAIRRLSDYVDVESVGIARDAGGLWRQWHDWGYTAEARIRTRVDHDGIAGPRQIVTDAFTYAASSPPIEQKEIPTVTAQGYDQDQIPTPSPGGTTKAPEQIPGLAGLGTFAILALIAVTATFVFVAKRG